MSYDSLAAYYDALVKDEEATAAWLDYTRRYCPPGPLLERSGRRRDCARNIMSRRSSIHWPCAG